MSPSRILALRNTVSVGNTARNPGWNCRAVCQSSRLDQPDTQAGDLASSARTEQGAQQAQQGLLSKEQPTDSGDLGKSYAPGWVSTGLGTQVGWAEPTRRSSTGTALLEQKLDLT